MKHLIFSFLIFNCLLAVCQEPYEKDGKWGLSKHGEGDDNDTIIIRATFDKIEMLVTKDGYFPIGLKEKKWRPLSANKLLNQQSYADIHIPEFNTSIAVAKSDGYIDVIDLVNLEFLIRNVKADDLVDAEVFDLSTDFLMTARGKTFGLISIESKKEIVKAKYTSIVPGQMDNEKGLIFCREEGLTIVFNQEGVIVHELNVEQEVVSLIQESDSKNLFKIMSKDGGFGMYNPSAKWLIDPIYSDVNAFEGSEEVVVVSAKKGEGVFFNGKLLAEAIYMSIDKSPKRGYIALVTNKKGDFLVDPEGKLTLFEE